MVRVIPRSSDRRGQLVLVAAGILAVALAAVGFAYLQLGYHADVRAGSDHSSHGQDADRFLSQAVHEAALAVDGDRHHRVVAERTRERLAPRLDTLRSSRVERGTAITVAYNRTAAMGWADRDCSGGDGREFEDCVVDGGLVLQDRAGDTHLVAVAFDVRIVTDRSTQWRTVVIGAGDGR